MTHQNVTRTVQCDVNYFMQNNNAANVFHCLASGAIDRTLLDDIAGVINGWLTTDWKPIAPVEWTANQIVLTGLNSLGDPRIAYPIEPPIAGVAVVGAMPANVTVAVKEDVGRRGKGIAGRWYWIGLTTAQVVDNTISTGAATAILAALNHLHSLLSAVPGCEGICVPHLMVGGARPNPASSDVITGFLLSDNSIDTQKDRLPFHKKRKRSPAA